MTIKQQIKHGPIQKACPLHNHIFHLIHLCHTEPILLITSPGLFTKNNKLSNKRKDSFLNMWLLQLSTLDQKR